MDEHQVILHGLSVLKSVTERVEKRRPVSLPDLRWLSRFFENYADKIHHHAEEELLFDALAAIAPKSLRRMMEQLITQHVMGRFFVARISEAVTGATGGLRGWRKQFVGSARSYEMLLSCHICSEDHHVFPAADRLIGKCGFQTKPESRLTRKNKDRIEKSLRRIASKYRGDCSGAGGAHQCERE